MHGRSISRKAGLKSHLYVPSPMERNGMQSRLYRTKGKFVFRCIRLEFAVDNLLENCSYPFRSKQMTPESYDRGE
uniref:Uncharacterized protein n=1 Tax=Romanomermis culicivorax TaxID=13658 RepID=A0A915KEG7_ROMCU